MTGIITDSVIRFLTSKSNCMLESNEISIRDIRMIAEKHGISVSTSGKKIFRFNSDVKVSYREV